jgi:hypothetical protein
MYIFYLGAVKWRDINDLFSESEEIHILNIKVN